MVLVVISYDVQTTDGAGRRRLRRVARVCENYGRRVQGSVFECWVDGAQLCELRGQLLAIIEPARDSIRVYHLGERWHGRVEHFGAKAVPDPDGPLIV